MNSKPAEKEFKYPPEVHFSAKDEYGVDVPPYIINSTYRNDFKGEFTKRPEPIKQEPDYYDILAGPYIDPLLPDEELSKRADRTKWESCDSLYKKFTEKYPDLKKKALPTVIDQSKILSEYTDLGKTVYQMEFGKAKKANPVSASAEEKSTRKETLKLPDDWVIPLSVYQTSFRNLTDLKNRKLLTFEMKSKAFKPPPTELGFTREEQEVLQTTTGETEYQEYYSNCGRDVMEHAFYGEIKPLPREFRPSVIEKENQQ